MPRANVVQRVRAGPRVLDCKRASLKECTNVGTAHRKGWHVLRLLDRELKVRPVRPAEEAVTGVVDAGDKVGVVQADPNVVGEIGWGR